jgi:hypothetical protein
VDDFQQQLLLRNDALTKENSELRRQLGEQEKQSRAGNAQAAEAERARKEADKALERQKAAEEARSAADRIADKEKGRRLRAEEELDNLKARIAQLQEQPSRLKQLRDEIEA